MIKYADHFSALNTDSIFVLTVSNIDIFNIEGDPLLYLVHWPRT